MTRNVSLTLSGVHLPGGDDPLGIWDLSSDGVVAFSAEPAFEGLVWHVDVPQASPPARADLRAQLREVGVRNQQLDVVKTRINHLGLMLDHGPAARAYAPPEGGESLGRAEAELLGTVAFLSSSTTAFGTLNAQQLNVRELYAQCQALLAQFRKVVRPVARVDTMVVGRAVGLTSIDLSGDHRTVWLEGVPPAEMDLHLDAVKLALASRQALLRVCVVVVTGALELALKAHIPGGQILLLPAVYRFVRDLLQELERLPAG